MALYIGTSGSSGGGGGGGAFETGGGGGGGGAADEVVAIGLTAAGFVATGDVMWTAEGGTAVLPGIF